MVERWTFADEDDPAPFLGSAAIAGGMVYAADANGVLHAIDLETGDRRWKYEADNDFETTPLVLGDRVIIGDLGGILHAVSVESGEKIWTFETNTPIHASANASPDGKQIVFGNDGAEVICVTAEGDEVWRQMAGDRVNSAPAIGFGAAFVSGCDGKLRAMSLTDGSERFGADLGGESAVSAALMDDRIVSATGRGQLVCYSSDGTSRLWLYEMEGGAGFFSSPAVSQGVVVVGGRDRAVHAVDAESGEQKWVFKTGGEVDSSPAISDGRVYVGSRDKNFYVLDLGGGDVLWQFDAGSPISGGPAVGAGVVVFGDGSGTLYCFEPEGE